MTPNPPTLREIKKVLETAADAIDCWCGDPNYKHAPDCPEGQVKAMLTRVRRMLRETKNVARPVVVPDPVYKNLRQMLNVLDPGKPETAVVVMHGYPVMSKTMHRLAEERDKA